MAGNLNAAVQGYQFRAHLATVDSHQWTAGVEGTAAWGSDGIGNFAGNRCPFATGHFHIRNGLQQQLRIGMMGIVEDIAHRGDFTESAQAHHTDLNQQIRRAYDPDGLTGSYRIRLPQQCLGRRGQGPTASHNVFFGRVLGNIVTDTTDARNEQPAGREALGENLGVVAGTAGHADPSAGGVGLGCRSQVLLYRPIHRCLKACFAHPVEEPLTRCHIFGRKGGMYYTGAIFSNGPKVLQVIHEPLRVDFRHGI